MFNKSWHKLLCVCLTMALVLSFVGCGSGQTGSEDATATKTLTVWFPATAKDGNDAEIWDEVVAPFEAEHDVDVVFQFVSWKDYEAKYSSGISTGTGPCRLHVC